MRMALTASSCAKTSASLLRTTVYIYLYVYIYIYINRYICICNSPPQAAPQFPPPSCVPCAVVYMRCSIYTQMQIDINRYMQVEDILIFNYNSPPRAVPRLPPPSALPCSTVYAQIQIDTCIPTVHTQRYVYVTHLGLTPLTRDTQRCSFLRLALTASSCAKTSASLLRALRYSIHTYA